jgi:MFS transporter, MHS family, alpha-ketoglutarate permease
LYFAPVFFPDRDRTDQLLQSAAVFAVGFFARPLGAFLMGLYADRAGRRAALTLSVALMCAGSLMIALAPGAAIIGKYAAVILLTARIVQGLSLGGEYGASATYLSEVASRKHRGFWSSFSYVTLIGGLLAALSVLIVLQHWLSPAQMTEWGWRVPFGIGAVLAIVAYRIRRRMVESEAFLNAKAAGEKRGGVLELIKEYPRESLVVLGLSGGGALLFYIYTTYMQKFLTNTAGFSTESATQISAATLAVYMAVQPLYGWLSDTIGRRPMIIAAFGGGVLFTYPIMSTLQSTHSAWTAFFLILFALLIQSNYTAISAVLKAEMFPTNIRTLGVALPYALSNALFGGTAETVALWFKRDLHESHFYIYASLISALSLMAALAMKDTRAHSRIVEE